MYSKLLLVLLSTCLLLQSSMGNAIPEAVETEASTEKPHFQLLFYVVHKLGGVAESILKSSKVMLQDVVDEFSALENNDEEITELVEVTKKLIADIKELDTTDDSKGMWNKLMHTLQELTGGFTETEDKKPIIVNKKFHESLQKHGWSNLKKEYDNKFEEFSKDFIEESYKIIDAITLQDWSEKNKFIDWLNEFKSEKSIDKKSDMFDEVLVFFMDSQDGNKSYGQSEE